MGYYVSNIIGIRTGGVFSDDTDVYNMKKRINKIIKEIKKIDGYGLFPEGLTKYSMSKELSSTKGSYVVIAGVFNYFNFEDMEYFCKELSKEFGTEVILTSWDEELDELKSNLYLNGDSYFNTEESGIGKAIRRII